MFHQVPPMYIGMTTTYLAVGMLVTVIFTGHTILHLNCKKDLTGGQKKSRNAEKKFARMMAVIGGIFLATWIPSMVGSTCFLMCRCCCSYHIATNECLSVSLVHQFTYT